MQPAPIFITLVKNTAVQFAALFGMLVIAATLLSLLSAWTNNAFRQFRFPSFGIYAFGVIGIPVHELCHAVFCKLFLHEVQSICWFDPKAKHGAYGSVTHTYNPWNPYHRIGHFFIGLAPVLLAPLILAGLFYWLVPVGRNLLSFEGLSLLDLGPFAARFFMSIGNADTLSSWQFWIFLYLAIGISSQMELSREDLTQAAKGLLPLILILFLINTLAWSLNSSLHDQIVAAGLQLVAIISCFYGFAILLSAVNLIFCTVIFSLIHRLTGKPHINPFQS